MKISKLLIALFAISAISANAEFVITSPTPGSEFRVGRTVTVQWTTEETFKKTLEIYASVDGPNGPWEVLLVKGGTTIKDVNSKDTTKPLGQIATILPRKATTNLYLKMQEKGNPDFATPAVGPYTVKLPQPSKVDSIITGNITNTITLSNKKVYGLKGVVYVQDGGVLRIEPGTIILGEIANTSAICINRGGKIYANGTPDKPIVMTSGAAPGQRDRGDWGGLLIMGRAKTNLGEAQIEGGISDGTDKRVNGWYGGNDDEDSSGVIRFVRIEFAGIAESPDNELNSLTMGSIGSRTVIEYVQCSYGGDDSFEWFGGTANHKYLIAYNGIDDDFDVDNGFRGKVQFGLSVRFPEIADQSNSQMFECDNDSKSSEREPFTSPTFSNITGIGPFKDLSWELGKEVNPKYLTAIQNRRNARVSVYNSVILGWPRGVEITNQNTVRGANNDSVKYQYNSFIGIKDKSKLMYFGSGTTPDGKITTDWLKTVLNGNEFLEPTTTLVNDAAKLVLPYPEANQLDFIDPSPKPDATFLNNANFDNDLIIPIADPFFKKVEYRGAFAVGERWDLPWAEYDPINQEYVVSVEDETSQQAIVGMNIFPQPANLSATLNFFLTNPTNVTLRLVDSYGNELTKFDLGLVNSGFQSQMIDLRTLSNGIYFVQVIANNAVTSQKIVVVK